MRTFGHFKISRVLGELTVLTNTELKQHYVFNNDTQPPLRFYAKSQAATWDESNRENASLFDFLCKLTHNDWKKARKRFMEDKKTDDGFAFYDRCFVDTEVIMEYRGPGDMIRKT